VKALPQNEGFETFACLKKISAKTGRNGNDFFNVEVGDTSGAFTFNCFSDTSAFLFFKGFKPAEGMCVLFIRGQVDIYLDRFSPRIAEVRIAEPEEVRPFLNEIVERPKESVEELRTELDGYIRSIRHERLRETVTQVLNDLGNEFLESVAAISMHHAYVNGLLEHTVHVTRVAAALLPMYPEVNADLALAGAIVHDVGKVIEYMKSGMDRTDLGRLNGHVVLGYRLFRSAALRCALDRDYTERIEHIVLSHQGQLEWGAAVLPSTPEAVFVALVDNLDAKMAMVVETLRKTSLVQSFSEFIPGLQTRLFVKPLDPLPDRSAR
jgi:3'-5' exoribonuclease